MPEIKKIEKICNGKWLSLEKISYTDSKGEKRDWESASRIKKNGAVLMVAFTNPSREIVLVRQFRPPSENYVIEFPAGLIDQGETMESAALRELEEECGLKGKILRVSNPVYSSPGMSSESVAFAVIEIDKSDPATFTRTKFDDSEDIETFLIPIKELPQFLKEREELGDKIDAKLAAASLFIEELIKSL